MLRALADEVLSLWEQLVSVNREMEILRKTQKEMLEINSTVTEMKNAFAGLTSGLDMAEERILIWKIFPSKLKSKENKD